MKKIGVFDTNLDTNFYKKKILNNEEKIIKKYPPTGWDKRNTDGGTGLGLNSLTARFYHFNVLNWFGTNSLRKCIKQTYELYTEQKHKCIYVQCWANVMRKGQKINPHYHREFDPYAPIRVSGNLVIYSDTLTNTFYENNPVENVIGRMVLFPSNVVHWTDQYMGDEERITVAFDIKTYDDWKIDVFDDAKPHWVKI